MKIALTLATLAALIVVIGIASRVTAQTPACVAGGAVAASQARLAVDCEILLEAKPTLEGETGNLNWSADLAISQWDGVRTAGSPRRVTIVRIQGKNLSGSIPAQLGRLNALEDLWLYTNDLTGTIPTTIGNLTELDTLMLAWNDLSGQIPNSLNNLDLDRLWLRGNNFTGCVPPNLLQVPDGDADQLGLPPCAGREETPPGDSGDSPPRTPTSGEPDTEEVTDLLKTANCTAEDIEAAFGELFSESFVQYTDQPVLEWDHNGRAWWFTYFTGWEVPDEDAIVLCRSIIFDNWHAAILGSNHHALRTFNEHDTLDTLLEWKMPNLPEIGDKFIGAHTYQGNSLDIEAGSIQGNSVLYRNGIVTVMLTAWGDAFPTLDPRIVTVAERIDARIAEMSDARDLSRGDAHSTTGVSPARDHPGTAFLAPRKQLQQTLTLEEVRARIASK